MSERKRIIISLVVAISALVLGLTIFISLNGIDKKGDNIYLNTVVETKKYNLNFEGEKETVEEIDYYTFRFIITNNLDEDQKFTFQNVFFVLNDGTKIPCTDLVDNGFTVEPHDEGKYFFSCPLNSEEELNNLSIHFGLNGDYHNLYNSTKTID